MTFQDNAKERTRRGHAVTTSPKGADDGPEFAGQAWQPKPGLPDRLVKIA